MSKEDCVGIGIDLGTTTSCVAVWIGDRVEVIPDHQTGSRIIPSYVSCVRIVSNCSILEVV